MIFLGVVKLQLSFPAHHWGLGVHHTGSSPLTVRPRRHHRSRARKFSTIRTVPQLSPDTLSRMDWSRVVDVADTVTAISAVVAVVVATWLGLKGIRLAKSGNDQAEKEFLYDQVDGVLQSALAVTAAASDLNLDPDSDPEPKRRTLRSADEAFQSRLRVLDALKLLPDGSRTATDVGIFATALKRTAVADEKLQRLGRQVLRPTLFDDADSPTADLLAALRRKLWDDLPAFSGTVAMTDEFDRKTTDPDWKPRADESVRLLLPYYKVENKLLELLIDNDGQPALMMDVWANELPGPTNLTQQQRDNPPPWSLRDVDQWFNDWPEPYLLEYVYTRSDNASLDETPEALSSALVNDLRLEFLDHVLVLIADLRSNVSALPAGSAPVADTDRRGRGSERR